MEKDFDDWNEQKKAAHARMVRAPFREREIWWCRLGANVGDEQDGKGRLFSRPVLIFKKFNAHIFPGLPLSTIIKDNRFYHTLHFKGIDQCVVLSQIKLMDAKRLENRMGYLPSREFDQIKVKLQQLIF